MHNPLGVYLRFLGGVHALAHRTRFGEALSELILPGDKFLGFLDSVTGITGIHSGNRVLILLGFNRDRKFLLRLLD